MTSRSSEKFAHSLSEAISDLESKGSEKSAQAKVRIEKEINELKEKIEHLQPYLHEAAEYATAEAKKAKGQIEKKVTENPWMALAVVGVVAFIIGFFLGGNKRDR